MQRYQSGYRTDEHVVAGEDLCRLIDGVYFTPGLRLENSALVS